jgi:hypothetical protein
MAAWQMHRCLEGLRALGTLDQADQLPWLAVGAQSRVRGRLIVDHQGGRLDGRTVRLHFFSRVGEGDLYATWQIHTTALSFVTGVVSPCTKALDGGGNRCTRGIHGGYGVQDGRFEEDAVNVVTG